MQVIETEHLNCCPFCGGEAEMIICNAIGGVEKSVRISCKKCRCSSNIFVTGRLAFPLKAGKDYVSLDEAKEKAINSWNNRPSN